MTEFDSSPARLSATLATVVGGLATVTHGVPAGAAIGAIGVLLLAIGAFSGSRGAVTTGAFVVFGGVVLAGLEGAAPEGLLVGTAATIVAWDVGEQAINVGEQLGRAAPTARGEVAHAASSILVAALVTGVGYTVYLSTSGGQPLAALILLVAAAITLAITFRN